MLHSTGLPTEDGKFFYIGNTHEVQRCHISTAHMSGSESMAWECIYTLTDTALLTLDNNPDICNSRVSNPIISSALVTSRILLPDVSQCRVDNSVIRASRPCNVWHWFTIS